MNWCFVFLISLLIAMDSSSMVAALIAGQNCDQQDSAQQWTLSENGQLMNAHGLCMSATKPTPIAGGVDLTMAPCAVPGNKEFVVQQWVYNKSMSWLVLAAQTNACINLEGYQTTPGSKIWVYSPCTPTDCKGNCDWHPSGGKISGHNLTLTNQESGLCLDDGSNPHYDPRTCEKGSITAHMPFCDPSLSFEKRAALLVSNLTTSEKIQLYMVNGMGKGIKRLNIKQFSWDSTDINGVCAQQSLGRDPKLNNTVYPNAIGLGATFDLALIKEMSEITAVEARILEELYYKESGGTYLAATNFDGGPLANVAYDPRVGRTSEMYGEDPFHTSRIGVTAMKALQNRTAEGFLQTSQVTRHFITDHGSSPDNRQGNYSGDLRWLEDEYLPTFEAFQTEGGAEGIMYSISALNGMSSVTNKYLFNKLIHEWGVTCIRQTDCCGTFNQAVSVHKNFNTTEDAVAAAMNAGIQLDYGDNLVNDINNALADGKLKMTTLNAAIERIMLTRFRLGEFDEAPRHPFWKAYDVSLLDSKKHRTSARRVMAASVVLLQNKNSVLPLHISSFKQIAVVGPFADCRDRTPGYGSHPCYLHSYNGRPAYISTILAAIQEEASTAGGSHPNITYARGCDFVKPAVPKDIGLAASLAASADLTILALGLGNNIEREGLDRSSLGLPTPQRVLLEAVRQAVEKNKRRSVLVLNSGGGVDVNVSDADAIVQVWYGGQETGHGLMDILVGRVRPSGRMPLTVHPQEYLEEVGPVHDLNMVFRQGQPNWQGRTYRYLRNQSQAIFSFGWGISYESFQYSNCWAQWNKNGSVDIKVTVKNLGDVDAPEVAQLYLSVPTGQNSDDTPVPKYALQGFQKVQIQAKSSVDLHFHLTNKQLTTVLANGTRTVRSGIYTVSVAGHLPSDPRAKDAPHASNVVIGTFVC